MGKIFADKKDDVGRAAIDYFSWGHVAMGICSFLLLSLINNIPSLYVGTVVDTIIPWWSMILLVIAIAIIWELIENGLLYEMGFKFEGRKDSSMNALWDVIFVIIGGFVMWIIKGVLVNMTMGVPGIPIFYTIGIVSFIATIIFFIIGKVITK